MTIALLSQETLITLAVGTSILALSLSALLFCSFIVLRKQRQRRIRRQQQFVQRWKQILRRPTSDVPPSDLPLIPPQNEFLFIRTWCQAYEAALATLAVPGSGTQDVSATFHHLRSIAKRAGLYETALSVAQEGPFRRQSIAIKCLGYLKDESALPFLKSLLDDEHAYLALIAFQAITRIDPQHATHYSPESIRADWPLSTYQQIIDEAYADPREGKPPHAQLSNTHEAYQAHEPERWPDTLSRLNRRVT